MKSIPYRITLTLIVVMVFYPLHSVAEPQILGIVSTSPVQLKCSRKLCQAVFSSFCLQQHRDIPKPGTRYSLLPNAEVALIITQRNGNLKSIKTPKNLSVKSVQNFTSVSISIPRKFINTQGGVSAAIRIGSLVSVIPENLGRGASAISQSEIKKFTGPVRTLAELIHTSGSLDAAIALHINGIVNQLISDKPAEAGDTVRLWQKIIGDMPKESLDSSLSRAAIELFNCETTSRNSASFGEENALGLKSCLQSAHDKHMNAFSRQVWQETDLGS